MNRALTILLVILSTAATSTNTSPEGPELKHVHVLFVCDGNYYRSRFAAAYLKYKANRLHLPLTVTSRGVKTYVHRGKTVSPLALKELQRRGIPADYAAGVPTPLTNDDLRNADRIIAMTRASQESAMRQLSTGQSMPKTEYWEIDDDETACGRLAQRIDQLVTELSAAKGSTPQR